MPPSGPPPPPPTGPTPAHAATDVGATTTDGARVAPATVQGGAVPAGFGGGLVGDGDDDDDGGGEEDDDDDDDDIASGTEDTPSESTDDDGAGGEARCDTVDSAPGTRVRQSPRLAELEANGAAVTSRPHNNTVTHQTGSE